MTPETTPPPDVDAIADALAAFMLAEHAAGRSLTARALTARASARFVGCSALLGAARRDLALHAELAWPHWSAAQLAARIRKLPAFERLVTQSVLLTAAIEDITATLAHAADEKERGEHADWVAGLQARRARLQADLPRIWPVAATAGSDPPRVESGLQPLADLARRIEISEDELDAALRTSRTPHAFRLLVMRKQSGGLRVIEQPQDALRVLQRRVLVIDDEEEVRNVTSRVLKHLGYEVTLAAGGLRSTARTPNQARRTSPSSRRPCAASIASAAGTTTARSSDADPARTTPTRSPWASTTTPPVASMRLICSRPASE